MKTVLSIILTPIFYLNFGLILGVFHIAQVLCFFLGGEKLHIQSSYLLSYLMLLNCRIFGLTTIKTVGQELLPPDRPLIIVSNHQTLLDIFAIVTTFRKFHPRFAAKIELGKGIPSVSYYLRKGGSALINRDNPRQAIGELLRVGKIIAQHNLSICIFAEGSRSKDGKVRPFQSAGVATLMKVAPNALLVPFVIKGHAEFQSKSLLRIGQKISYTVLTPIDPQGRKADELVLEIEQLIRNEVASN